MSMNQMNIKTLVSGNMLLSPCHKAWALHDSPSVYLIICLSCLSLTHRLLMAGSGPTAWPNWSSSPTVNVNGRSTAGPVAVRPAPDMLMVVGAYHIGHLGALTCCIYCVEYIHSVGTINNLKTSYSTQLKYVTE